MMGGRTHDAMEPLAFAVLAGLTPQDVELDFFDERLEEIPADLETDLVAMTVETYTARRAYQIASAYRRRGIPVVMGGYHASFLPDEALQIRRRGRRSTTRKPCGKTSCATRGSGNCERPINRASCPTRRSEVRPPDLPGQTLPAGGAGAIRAWLQIRL